MKDIASNDLENNIPMVGRRDGKPASGVRVGEHVVGGGDLTVIAGPCTIESLDQLLDIAKNVKAAGAHMLRGGAYKALTFPYRSEKVFELGDAGLEMLREARRLHNIPIVTEVIDVRLVETVAATADVLQIGARNMQNFPLLEECARTGLPVLLKRHFGASLRDWLGAAEYFLYNDNPNVILCERGVSVPHTHHSTARFIADIQAVPAVQEFSHLPIVVDPSHATFRRSYVPAIARAAIAAGADGVMVEVHPVPEQAAVDPLQALDYRNFAALVHDLQAIGKALERRRG